jgi:hypothetical protein
LIALVWDMVIDKGEVVRLKAKHSSSAAPHGRALVASLLIAMGTVLLAVPSAHATDRAFLSSFGNQLGEPAGHVAAGNGVAVNSTGVGGAAPGSVYVPELTNGRVSVFSASGTFLRAFGWDVVASGPDDSSANEQQVVNIPSTVTGGTFTLSVTTATGTGVNNSGGSSTGLTGVEQAIGNFNVGDAITGTGIESGATIVAVGPNTLTLSKQATSEGFARALTATETTAAIPYNATAAELKTALESLPGIGAGNVSVAGGPGAAAPFTVTFSGGYLAGDNVATMTIANSLTGGTGTVATGFDGGGYEVCNASSLDRCKAGSKLPAAGSSGSAEAIAVDQSAGNVFVSDSQNRRVNVYTAEGAFEAGIGLDTIPGGAIGTGSVALGSPAVSGVTTTSGAFFVGEPITGTGIPPRTTIAAVANGTITLSQVATATAATTALTVPTGTGNVAVNEQQTVTLPAGVTGGTYTLTFSTPNPSNTTGTATGIPFNATAAEVQAKLQALANLGTGNVEVTGSPGGPYTVEFKGKFADVNVTQMTASGAGLTPSGTVAIATSLEGTGVEACTTSCQTGSAGAAAGAFGNLVGAPLAIDPTEGDLYVGEQTNFRINEFSLTLNGADEVTGSSFVRAFGWDVVPSGRPGDTGAGLETCTTASSCKAGTEGGGDGQMPKNGPRGLAVDSDGYIYMVPTASAAVNCATVGICRVQKFKPDGSFDKTYGPNSGGDEACQLTWTSGTANLGAATGIAIDPSTQNVIVVRKASNTSYQVCEFASEAAAEQPGALLSRFPANPRETAANQTAYQPAIGTEERIYVNSKIAGQRGATELFGPVPPPPAPKMLPVTDIAQTSAKLHGEVFVPAPGGEGYDTKYHFEYRSGGDWISAPVPDANAGTVSGAHPVEETIEGLEPNTQYRVRLKATTSSSVVTDEVGFTTSTDAPSVVSTSSTATQTEAVLSAWINPRHLATTYHFEWGASSLYGHRAPAFERAVGSGSAPIAVQEEIAGLAPETTYHYRVVATSHCNLLQLSELCTTQGPDREFETANAAGLPAHRGIELVSPADKRPAGAVQELEPQSYGVSEDGEAISYPLYNGVADSTASGSLVYMGRRTSDTWESSQVSGPSLIPASTHDFVAPSTVRWVDEQSGSCALVESFNPLTPDTPEADLENGVKNLYLWDAATGSYTLITDPVPVNAGLKTPSTAFLIAGATGDCSRFFFVSSTYRYLSGDNSSLYEWDEGTLRDAGLRPDGSPLEPGNIQVARSERTVSPDGTLFYSGESNEGDDAGKRAVFVRRGPGDVIDASHSVTGIAPNGVTYQTASADGSHVFFLANYGLASPASINGTQEICAGIGIQNSACALYSYDVDTGALVEISRDGNPADTKGPVAQGVVDVSEDGSTVYFAARGQLVPKKGKTYTQNLAGAGSANLYRWKDGELEYVAPLSAGDLVSGNGAFQSALVTNPGQWVARTTKSGNQLVFVSRANITGSNPDGVPAVYVYMAPDGIGAEASLGCISCPADGRPPTRRPPGFVVPAIGPVPPPDLLPPQLNVSFAASYPRGLSDDGRVVFASEDALTPGAVQGHNDTLDEENNIYEWHRGQISLLTSGAVRLIGLGGPNGRDAVVRSYSRLDPHDFDFAADVYDFRIGGGFAPPPPPPVACDPAADECQGTPSPGPSSVTPGSAEFAGPGNPVQAPQGCGKGKIRRHGKCVRKKRGSKKHRRAGHHRSANSNRGGVK